MKETGDVQRAREQTSWVAWPYTPSLHTLHEPYNFGLPLGLLTHQDWFHSRGSKGKSISLPLPAFERPPTALGSWFSVFQCCISLTIHISSGSPLLPSSVTFFSFFFFLLSLLRTHEYWCFWVNSGSWWWTGRPGVLQSMGSQRVGHDWVTELNWTDDYPEATLVIQDNLPISSFFICDSIFRIPCKVNIFTGSKN